MLRTPKQTGDRVRQHAMFSNGLKIEARDQRRTYSHAWYAAGQHRLSNQPWSFQGFASSAKVAQQRMVTMTAFARPDGVTFAEVVAVAVSP
jgi:hypothetical protein